MGGDELIKRVWSQQALTINTDGVCVRVVPLSKLASPDRRSHYP